MTDSEREVIRSELLAVANAMTAIVQATQKSNFMSADEMRLIANESARVSEACQTLELVIMEAGGNS